MTNSLTKQKKKKNQSLLKKNTRNKSKQNSSFLFVIFFFLFSRFIYFFFFFQFFLFVTKTKPYLLYATKRKKNKFVVSPFEVCNHYLCIDVSCSYSNSSKAEKVGPSLKCLFFFQIKFLELAQQDRHKYDATSCCFKIPFSFCARLIKKIIMLRE